MEIITTAVIILAAVILALIFIIEEQKKRLDSVEKSIGFENLGKLRYVPNVDEQLKSLRDKITEQEFKIDMLADKEGYKLEYKEGWDIIEKENK